MNTIVAEHQTHDATLTKYVVGFVSSVVLTLASYLLVTHTSLSKDMIVGVISVLAVTQFVVQMVLFLHVGAERRPRWKLAVMVMMLAVVLILVGGSIWIMNNLNYRMTPAQQRQYLHKEDAF